MTIFWAPLLHVYQPPWQDLEILKEIYKECYVPLLSMLERHENVKITLNVQGCLLDLLTRLGLEDAREILRNLIQNGKVELIGSAKYHPILPLIPKDDIIHQIKLNEKTLNHHFPGHPLKGFFPPEMAISINLCQIIKSSGYSWTILDGIANSDKWPHDYIQKSESGLITFFRDSFVSNMISFAKIDADGFVEKISQMYGEKSKKDNYIITAQDAETFGHHIKFYETRFLGKVFSLIEDRDDISMCFLSDLVDLFPIQKAKKPIKPSSWSTTVSDIASRVPYPLWASPLNPVHKYQFRMLKSLYKLMNIVEKYSKLNGKDSEFQNYYKTARYFYDQSMHSCWLWWASMKPMWSPNLIYKGADLIMKAALNAQLALINLKVGTGDEDYGIIMDNTEKLMNEIIDQEAAGQKVRTYGDF